jgi:hypothetical protein
MTVPVQPATLNSAPLRAITGREVLAAFDRAIAKAQEAAA